MIDGSASREGLLAEQPIYLSQRQRVLVLAINVVLFYAAYVAATGQWKPAGSGEAVWFWAALSMWLLSLLAAPWFMPPRDALAAALTAGVLVATIDLSGAIVLATVLDMFRWGAFGVALVTVVSALTAILFRSRDTRSGFGEVCYRLSENLGRSEVVFTPPALLSIAGFYQDTMASVLGLMTLWVFFVVVRPVELVVRTWNRLGALARAAAHSPAVGLIQRVDDPNIIRVALASPADWQESIYVAVLAGDRQRYALPLFAHTQEDEVIGTGLCHGNVEDPISDVEVGHVYRYSGEGGELRERLIGDLSGIEQPAHLVGFVVEGSSISDLRFEVSRAADLEEGHVVFVNQGGTPVYYQILDASTAEESFGSNPGGKQIASAAQLGSYDRDRALLKYPWLPMMNRPVFRFSGEPNFEQSASEGEFFLGTIPSTGLRLRVCLRDLAEYHAAILGVTGTGKTEMALDIVRNALDGGFKVFCVDFTGEYRGRLGDRQPENIGLTMEEGGALEQLLLAVETGEFGAKKERASLNEFLRGIDEAVSHQVDQFLTPKQASLGILELAEIANSKATLRTTELYLSAIISWARQHRKARRVLVVLEEAHTIIPETTWSGFDTDTQWV